MSSSPVVSVKSSGKCHSVPGSCRAQFIPPVQAGTFTAKAGMIMQGKIVCKSEDT